MHSRSLRFILLGAASSALLACSGAGDTTSPDDTSSEALGVYDRQTVYDEVRHSAHAPGDLLKSSVTDARLVDAVGWLMDHDPPSFYITAIRSDHHNDGAKAHAGGHALDMYASDSGEARRLLELLDENPYVVEIGLGGAYKTYRSTVTKMYFNDNNATHMHIGVVHAFGR